MGNGTIKLHLKNIKLLFDSALGEASEYFEDHT
jgi:hypothetical protein